MNQKPIANITTISNTAMINENVKFDGSNSYDPDGNIIEWIWEIDNQIILNQKEISKYFTDIGDYLITLKVKDEKGELGSESIQITILENQKPEAKPRADKTNGRAPLKVNFTGNAIDKDGEIILYHWDFGDKSILKNSTSNNQNTSYIYLRSGVYVVNFTVTDDQGESDSKMIKIEVKPNLLTVGYRFFLYMRWILNSIKNVLLKIGGI